MQNLLQRWAGRGWPGNSWPGNSWPVCAGLSLLLGLGGAATALAGGTEGSSAGSVASSGAQLDAESLGLFNYHRIDPLLATAGLISDADVQALADAGFEYVINLAVSDPRRSNPNEAFAVTERGLSYAQIPVDWQQPTAADLQLFFALMDARGGRKTLVHCFGNYRVSAFVYLYRTLHLGEDEAAARADLDALWTPEQRARHPHWVAFMEQMRASACVDC